MDDLRMSASKTSMTYTIYSLLTLPFYKLLLSKNYAQTKKTKQTTTYDLTVANSPLSVFPSCPAHYYFDFSTDLISIFHSTQHAAKERRTQIALQ